MNHDFSGLNMPWERGLLSCRPRATSGAAFGVGEVLLKCPFRYVGWLFLCNGLHPQDARIESERVKRHEY